MTAQAQTAQDDHHPFSDQQTPVIIKVGGGDLSAVTDTMPVNIDSPLMPFSDPVAGLTWETAQSTQTGRIIEVSYVDGRNTPRHDIPIPSSNELASVRLEFGAAQLLIMETGVAPDVLLAFASAGATFNIRAEGDWTSAAAQFPPVTGIVVMQGKTLLAAYQFLNPDDVSLNVQFLESE